MTTTAPRQKGRKEPGRPTNLTFRVTFRDCFGKDSRRTPHKKRNEGKLKVKAQSLENSPRTTKINRRRTRRDPRKRDQRPKKLLHGGKSKKGQKSQLHKKNKSPNVENRNVAQTQRHHSKMPLQGKTERPNYLKKTGSRKPERRRTWATGQGFASLNLRGGGGDLKGGPGKGGGGGGGIRPRAKNNPTWYKRSNRNTDI